MELTAQDIDILNSKIGLRALFADEKIDVMRTLRQIKYELRLRDLQAELIKLQSWVIDNNKKVVILFEGRDAAGKGGAIRRITSYINPRFYRTVALTKPTLEEQGQWYFQRYVDKLPQPGEMVFFDRSWYNRAVVEPVNGFCTEKEYDVFMGQVNQFEQMLVEADTFLIKLYFSINKKEQAKRFADIQKNPLKKWKMSDVDRKAQGLWDEYTKYKKEMFKHTNSDHAPWTVIEANRKTEARIEAMEHVLKTIPYK